MNSQQPAVLPHFERMFGAAAAARIDPSVATRRAGRNRARLPRIAAIALAGAVFAGTAGATTGLWDPPIGGRANDGPPAFTSSPVPPRVERTLGTLRRPPTARDRGADVKAALAYVSSYHFRGVRPQSIRYVSPGYDGAATILFSAEETDGANGHWRGGNLACLQQGLPDGSIPECFEIGDVLDGSAFGTVMGPHLAFVFGLVPDGVAEVTVHFSSHRSEPIPVVNNHFELRWGARQREPLGEVGSITMLDPQGAVVRPEE